MTFSELMCDYVYNSFLLVEGSLEVAMRLAASVVNMLNSLVDSILYTFKYVVDAMLQTLIDALKVAQKSLLDLLWNKIRPDAFCANLYKCSIVLEDLADENSLIWKTCVKAGIINDKDGKIREQVYDMLNDYNTFKQQICEYGFTTTFGIDALRKITDYISEQAQSAFDYLMKRKDAFRRTVQKFLDDIENLGIFDLLDRLKKYFNCIIDSSETCSSIRSASNYYKDTLSKLHLEESGSNGYRLETSLNNKILNGFDARIAQVNNIKSQIDSISEMLVNPNDTASANKAYDLSKNVFPGSMTWSDIKNARMIRKSTFIDTWKKTGAGQYITVKYDALFNDVYNKKGAPDYLGTDYLIGNTIINDVTGEIKVRLSDETTLKYVPGDDNYDTMFTAVPINVGNIDVSIDDTDIVNYQNPTSVDDNSGISSFAAAILMATDPNNEISKKLLNKSKNIYERFPNTIPESELVTAWE